MSNPLTAEEISSFAEAGVTDAELSLTGGAYFPARYLYDFFRFIKENPDKLNVINYNDLNVENGEDYKNGYKQEYVEWKKRTEADKSARSKAHLLIQYDIDSRPERMHSLLSNQAHDQIPSNIMIFNRRIDRRHLMNTGEVRYTEYDLDETLLRKRQSEGFVIGYHTNAYERSGHDMTKALEIFNDDMIELQKRFGVEHFSAHGGVPGPDGRNNNGLEFHPDWVDRAVWVHNGINLKFDGSFSDGGHNSPKRDPALRDFRDFVAKMKAGGRYRILLHPQYYDEKFQISKRYGGTPWYDDMLRTLYKHPKNSLWNSVKLKF